MAIHPYSRRNGSPRFARNDAMSKRSNFLPMELKWRGRGGSLVLPLRASLLMFQMCVRHNFIRHCAANDEVAKQICDNQI